MDTHVLNNQRKSISIIDELSNKFGIHNKEILAVNSKFPMQFSAYYYSLIKNKNDAIWKQCIPDVKELEDAGFIDPLHEEHDSPLKCIVHRYPDRVLYYCTSECAMFCRFCTSKHKVGKQDKVTKLDWLSGFEYIRNHREIRDVIISGGDPLTLSDNDLEFILSNIRKIEHVQIIRIGTRVPVANPKRITDKLSNIIKQFHPLYVNTHFNHPNEITSESTRVCEILVNAGIPLGNQSVLLKGVNDNIETMRTLVQKLLTIRVKPYLIYMMDLVKGADHFRTSVQTGLDIIDGLRGHTSGMAVPHLVIDAPDGGGKIAIMPDVMQSNGNGMVKLKNYENKYYTYPAE